MSQSELNEAIARSTGEDIRLVQELGFSIADPTEVNFDPEPDDVRPQVVDWDQLALARNVPIFA
jgi:hypothetical protein